MKKFFNFLFRKSNIKSEIDLMKEKIEKQDKEIDALVTSAVRLVEDNLKLKDVLAEIFQEQDTKIAELSQLILFHNEIFESILEVPEITPTETIDKKNLN